MFDYAYRVWADAGCAHNGTQEAHGYASYLLQSRTGQRQIVRLSNLPGVTTNNEAEYVTLISALVDLRGRIERAGKSPRSYSVVVQTDDALREALVSAIENLRGWSDTYADLVERRAMAQAVWHAAHDNDRPGATASAAFQAFQPEVLAQLQKPRPRPVSEIVILGAQHPNNLGERVAEYEQPRTIRLRILLEDYQDTYGRPERRLAAYEIDDRGEYSRRIGYLPKDAPRREGSYLAMLHRPEGKKRLEGRLSPLSIYESR